MSTIGHETVLLVPENRVVDVGCATRAGEVVHRYLAEVLQRLSKLEEIERIVGYIQSL